MSRTSASRSELRVWLTLTFILWQFVLGVSNQEIARDNSPSGGMSCVCDGNCERVAESECPWGLTLDVCGCCLACARGENEPCGGALGNCAAGLNCQLEGSASEKTGTCTKSAEKCSAGAEKFGCGVESGKCTCRVWSGCSNGQPFALFESEDDCHAQAEAEEDDDEDECEGVKCDEALECPADSHPSPRLVQGPGPRLRSGCCPSLGELCQCNPPSACPQPTCPFGSTLRLLHKATNSPGNCCPVFSCETDD